MEVLAALSDPDEVLATLRNQRPDLVVLDLRMPATDGLTLLRRMRAEIDGAKDRLEAAE